MKHLIIILLLVVTFAASAQKQPLFFQELTDKYASTEGFSASLISSDMFDIYIKRKDIDEKSPVFETLKRLDNILVASQSTYGQKKDADISGIHTEILEHYKKENFTLFKTEKRMGEDVKVFLKKAAGEVSTLALITASTVSVNLIEMNGVINLANLGELSRALNIRGLENLYKIKGSSSYGSFDGAYILPDFDARDYNSDDFFTGEPYLELNEHLDALKDQKLFSEDQREKFEQQSKEMAARQAEMAEKYREMAEKYKRQPIFLSYPGDTSTIYYIDGKKVKSEAVKKLDKDKIESIEINKSDKKNQSTVKIKTK